MFLLSRPNNVTIDEFLRQQCNGDLTYSGVGLTESQPPNGYIVDHNRLLLGHGESIWEGAKQAIREWRMFDLAWINLFPQSAPIEVGQSVAILIRHFGFYSLNAARIVYTIDEPDRFGFAYGTLEDHGESGEERFMVDRDPASGDVCYDIKAFSRPNHSLAYLGYPIIRSLQKQFAAGSKLAMLRAVQDNQIH
jgi:uncharacterized protein (UPF0548 family)